MFEFLTARIALAESRILKSLDPRLANEKKLVAHEISYSIGINEPDLTAGALANDEPELLATFHEGVGCHHWHQTQIDLDYKYVDYL